MSDPVLCLPRRLAIELLAHAQRLPAGESISGFLAGTAPEAVRFQAGAPPASAPVWSWVRAQDGAGAPSGIPPGAPRVLTVALDTKGVLQLRCWEPAGGAAVRECVLRIGD